MTRQRIWVDDIDRCEQAVNSVAITIAGAPLGALRRLRVVDFYDALTPIGSVNGGRHDR